MGRQPAYEQGYEQFQRFIEKTAAIEILIEKDGKRVAALQIDPRTRRASLEDVTPGQYVLKLWTGRQIWKGRLEEEDLIWMKAFPGTALKVAADTGKKKRPSTRMESILRGELILRLRPGMESGTLELQLKRDNT
jgi:hypothetical protein